MAEIVIPSPQELPKVLAEAAGTLGGAAYRDRAIAAFVLSRQVKPHTPNRDSYVKFGADYKVPTKDDTLEGISYHVERGDRYEVASFSQQVRDVFAEMDHELEEVSGYWVEDAHASRLRSM